MSRPAITDRLPDLSAGLCHTRENAPLFRDLTQATAGAARDVCRSGCPAIDACREWGIRYANEEIWGGLTPPELRAARRERRVHLSYLRNGEVATTRPNARKPRTTS